MVWYGMIWHGMAWHGMVWYGMVWYGMVWYGMVWYGMVWHGMVWHGMVWLIRCCMYLNASSFFVPPPAIPDVQYKVNACIILISLACSICCGLQGGVNVYPPGFGSSFSKLRGLPPILSIMKLSEAPGISSKQSRTPTNSTSSKLRKALNNKYLSYVHVGNIPSPGLTTGASCSKLV